MLYTLVWLVFAACVGVMSYATAGLMGWHSLPLGEGVGERMVVFSMATSVFVSGPILASLFGSGHPSSS